MLQLHLEEYAKEDPQFLADLNVAGKTYTNHEIDMEVPASCPSMCPGGVWPGVLQRSRVVRLGQCVR